MRIVDGRVDESADGAQKKHERKHGGVANAAISAGYYLRIVGSLFLATESPASRFVSPARQDTPVHHPIPVLASVGVSMVAVLWFGTIWPSTSRLLTRTAEAAHIETAMTSSVAAADQK